MDQADPGSDLYKTQESNSIAHSTACMLDLKQTQQDINMFFGKLQGAVCKGSIGTAPPTGRYCLHGGRNAAGRSRRQCIKRSIQCIG